MIILWMFAVIVFHPVAYYRGAMGILLVYDVTDESSFNSELFYCLFIKNWFEIATVYKILNPWPWWARNSFSLPFHSRFFQLRQISFIPINFRQGGYVLLFGAFVRALGVKNKAVSALGVLLDWVFVLDVRLIYVFKKNDLSPNGSKLAWTNHDWSSIKTKPIHLS